MVLAHNSDILVFLLSHKVRVMNIKDLIEVNPEKMSGVPVFAGTRVPIGHLFEYLEKGETLTEFLRQFPSVTHEQALGVLELSKESLLANHEIAA
jgi:uncharacterized protein (DUF433 family)